MIENWLRIGLFVPLARCASKSFKLRDLVRRSQSSVGRSSGTWLVSHLPLGPPVRRQRRQMRGPLHTLRGNSPQEITNGQSQEARHLHPAFSQPAERHEVQGPGASRTRRTGEIGARPLRGGHD